MAKPRTVVNPRVKPAESVNGDARTYPPSTLLKLGSKHKQKKPTPSVR